jgi:hypothetical protein
MDLRQLRGFFRGGRSAVAARAAVVALAALGCGADRYIVLGTARAPSTAGFIEASGSGGSSANVEVHMEQLHPVDSLDPSLHAYVVWFEHDNSPPVRAGSLRYKADDRLGELQAKAPFRKFVVKITAEANDKPKAPSEFVVATQEISID